MGKKKIEPAASNRRKKASTRQPPSRSRPPAALKSSPRSRPAQESTASKASLHSRQSASKNAAVLHEQAALLQLTHDSIIVTDLNDVITFWNRGAEEQYGWAASEAIGQVSHILLKTQFPQPFEKIRAGLLCDGRWEGELVHSQRDGTSIVVACRWDLRCDAQGQPVAILEINNNITERKRTEAKHQQWNVELEQRVTERTANLEDANAQLEELNVALEEEMTERKRAEEEIDRLNHRLKQRARELETSNEELQVTNEELRLTNEGLGKEIVERRQVEQSLRQSEERYRSLFENLLNGFAYCQMLFDDHGRPVDFVYLDVNAAFEKLTGLKDVIGKRVTAVIPGIREEHPELFEIYGRVALTGRPAKFDLEFKPLAIWLSLSVYSPEEGYFVAVFENITERVRTDVEREQMHRDLERHAHELEVTNKELEAFTYTVSHDLRGPLNQIEQLARLLHDEHGQQLNEQGQRVLQLIQEDAGAMNRLADELLTLARLSQQSPTKQPVAMSDLVRQVLDELSPEGALVPPESSGLQTPTDQALSHGARSPAGVCGTEPSAANQRHIEIRVGELAPAQADPFLLKQVWSNLIANAIKFTRPRQVAHIEIGSTQEQGRTIYWVKDNGVGFEMVYAGRLFRAFQRLHHAEDFEGNGLGLAMVERVIRRHGGRVWAEAQVDQGATFSFTLS